MRFIRTQIGKCLIDNVRLSILLFVGSWWGKANLWCFYFKLFFLFFIFNITSNFLLLFQLFFSWFVKYLNLRLFLDVLSHSWRKRRILDWKNGTTFSILKLKALIEGIYGQSRLEVPRMKKYEMTEAILHDLVHLSCKVMH